MTVPQPHPPRRRWIKRAIVLALLLVVAAYAVHRAVPRGDAAAEIDRLVALLQISPGMTVAEIGAGAGAMTLQMADSLGSMSRVYATELNPERLDQIREVVQDAGLAHVTILEAGKAETNLPAECCDAIFMSKVYHHFTDPEAINRSLYDSLKPGGALAVIDFEPDVWNFWLPHPEGVPEDRGGHGAPRSLVAKELEAAGFEIEEQISDWWPRPFRRFCVVARKLVAREPL